MEDQSNSSLTCRNCGAPIQASDAFCSNCGQKNTDGRITVGSLFSEFISATLNLDSKIFRTIRDLCIPGKLTIEYFKGRHKKYVHPVRLFLVTFILIVAFGILDNVTQGFNEGANEKPLIALQKLNSESKFRQWFYDKIYYPNQTDSLTCINNLDSLECNLYEYFPENPTYYDSIRIKILSFVDQCIATEDLLELPPENLIKKYEIEGKFKSYLFSQQVKIQKNSNGFSEYVFGNAVWILLFMMPFLGLLLHLFNYKKDMYYVEHLIFSLHTHAFVFVGIAVLGLLINLLPISYSSIFDYLLLIIPYLYFFLALKKVYQYSFRANLFVFVVLSITYFILLMVFFLINMFISILII